MSLGNSLLSELTNAVCAPSNVFRLEIDSNTVKSLADAVVPPGLPNAGNPFIYPAETVGVTFEIETTPANGFIYVGTAAAPPTNTAGNRLFDAEPIGIGYADNTDRGIQSKSELVADTIRQWRAICPVGTTAVITGRWCTASTPPPASIDLVPPVSAVTLIGSPAVGDTSIDFEVEYSDLSSVIDVSTIGAVELVLASGTTISVPLGSAPNTDQTPATATYTANLSNPLSEQDDGTAVVRLPSGSPVSDIQGNSLSAGSALGSFLLALNTTTPTVSLLPPSITAGATEQTATVRITDPAGVDVSTISSNAFSVSGPNGYAPLVTANIPSVDSTSVDIDLIFTPPNGAWGFTENGTYTVSFGSGIRDLGGQEAPAGVAGTFVVNITDSVRPIATILNAPDFDVDEVVGGPPASPPTYSFTIRYADSGSLVDAATLGSNDFEVVTPQGQVLPATLASRSSTTNAATIDAVYTINRSDNTGDAWDYGTQTIRIKDVGGGDGSVQDGAGNAIQATDLGSFNINFVRVPEQAPDLWGWWDETSISESGGVISQWNDISGAGRVFSATDCLVEDGAVGLNGSSSFLTGGAFLPAGEITIFIVYTQQTRGFRNWILSSGDQIALESGTWSGLTRFARTASENMTANAGTNPALNERVVAAGKVGASSGSLKIVGQTTNIDVSDVYTPPLNNPSGQVRLGNRPSSGFWFDGVIYEVLIYDRALSVAEEASVQSYLSNKWV